MRPIKFRAWDKDSSEMYYEQGKLSEFRISLENGVMQLLLDCEDTYGEVRDADIMQFTGLLDKNGKEIYEGDILKINNFDNRNWVSHEFQIITMNYGEIVTYMEFIPHSEIIGNSYENELLTK